MNDRNPRHSALPAWIRVAAITLASVLTVVCIVAASLAPNRVMAQANPTTPRAVSQHLVTGFALTGAHEFTRCETCHVRGVFKGTPRACAGCHGAGARVSATTMPPTHAPTQQPCQACHNTVTFTGARFVHAGIIPGTCASCHNGATATGKPSGHVATTASCDTCHRTSTWTGSSFSHAGVAGGTCASCHNGTAARGKAGNHVPTTASCDTCHRTTGWTPATFSHTGVTPGTCASCHNGTTARGKTANHVPTTASCDTCHRTTGWTPATFSHTGVTPGSCASCHNGTTARGKPTGHLPTTLSCDSCHRTTAWTPATFTHTGVTPGSCATCHNGTAARGKSAGHFLTTKSCDACHRTTGWTPLGTYSHLSPGYKAHGAGLSCASCHKNNSEVLAWPAPAYKPDCAGCHASTFKPGSHKKVDSPQILYTVAELRNCNGSCHQYNDSTFTTIKKSRTGEHRPTDGGF